METANKFCINNKIKEVSYKILQRIYPAKHVLERFKLNICIPVNFVVLFTQDYFGRIWNSILTEKWSV